MPTFVAVFNAGSSSIKFALRDAEAEGELLFRGQAEGIGVAPRIKICDADGQVLVERSWPPGNFDHAAATEEILRNSIELLGGTRVTAIGHRVVHGGSEYSAPVVIDPRILSYLARLEPL